jgi:hypothetical protein
MGRVRVSGNKTAHGDEKMTQQLTEQQVEDVVCRIVSNETRLICELSDGEIEGYLVDAGFEETDESVAAIRKA